MKVKVGDVYMVERRSNGHVFHSHAAAVTRVTAKRAYLGDVWFAFDDKNRTVKPRYLHYWTIAIPVPGAAKDEAPRGGTGTEGG